MSHRMGNKFPTDLWGQVLQAELLSQQTSSFEGFFPWTDGEETLPSQLENGHEGYNENCWVDQPVLLFSAQLFPLPPN